jgi:hypothetical protein
MEREEKAPHLIPAPLKVTWTCLACGKKTFQTFKIACLSNVGKNIHEISEPEDFLCLPGTD